MASNVVMIGTIFAERLMYLPSIFVCLLVAMVLARLRPVARNGILFVFLLLASARTVTYSYQWNDRLRLYRYVHQQQPKGSMIYLLLAGEYSDRGDKLAADAVLAEGRRVCPEASQVWLRSALLKIDLGDLDTAEEYARKSLRLRPVGSAEAILRKIGALRDAATTRPK